MLSLRGQNTLIGEVSLKLIPSVEVAQLGSRDSQLPILK